MTMIGVYAHWDGLPEPMRLGYLHSRRTRTQELFEFEYDLAALKHAGLSRLQFDPAIGLFEGPQYPAPPHGTFGAFADSSPDRWGRMLMERRLISPLSTMFDLPPGISTLTM